MNTDTVTIQNGKYRAKLCSVRTSISQKGIPGVTFNWELADGSARRIYSRTSLLKNDGKRNEIGIGLVRRWVPEWDGKEVQWFEQNHELLRGRTVELVIENKPWYKDPSMIGPEVKFVNPIKPTSGVNNGTTPVIISGLIAPNMIDVIGAYAQATNDMDPVERDRQWIEIVRHAVPDKDQDLFTNEDWQKVIDHLRGVAA